MSTTAAKRAKKARLAQSLHNDDQLATAVSRHVSLDLIVTSLELERDAELKAIQEKYAAKNELSYRLGNPTVATVKGVTQKAVLADLLKLEDEEFADRFIAWKESLNTEAILDAWKTPEDQTRLHELGLDVEQVERFHLTPSLATAEPTTGQPRPAAA